MNRRTVGSRYGVVDLGLHRALELAIGSALIADRVLAFLMAAVALVTALSGEAATAGVCAAAAVAQALLSLTTRYVKGPRSDEDTRVTPAGA
jgi:hypothetical protein